MQLSWVIELEIQCPNAKMMTGVQYFYLILNQTALGNIIVNEPGNVIIVSHVKQILKLSLAYLD